MVDSTILREEYPFCKDYTDDGATSVNHDFVLQEFKNPMEKRAYLLNQSATYDSSSREVESVPENKDIKTFLFAPQKRKNNIDYICQSTRWIGYVLEIKENSFTAKLVDIDDNTTYEIADFDKTDVSTFDKDLLTVGAVFYWSVGYANRYGQISKQSLVRFRRSIDLGIAEFDPIIDKAEELNHEIVWE